MAFLVKNKREQSVLIYGAFVLCNAAEIMLSIVLKGKPDEKLKHESRFYFMQMMSNLKKAEYNLREFNNITASEYYKHNAGGQFDGILRDAYESIRDYCYRRNAIDSDEDAAKYDAIVNNYRLWHPGEVVSQETINYFNIK